MSVSQSGNVRVSEESSTRAHTHPQREGQGVHEYKTEIRLGEETKRIQPFLTLTAAFWKRCQNFMTFQHQTDAGFGGGVPSIYIYALLAKLQ